MKKILHIFSFILLTSVQLFPQNTRAIWIWGSSASIIETPHVREAFFEFCASPPGFDDPNAIEGYPGSINTLYISANYHMSGDSIKQSILRNFLKEAHSRGITVEFLAGAANWATTNMAAGKERIDAFYRFNSGSVNPDEKFDGVQYDVEPYLLPGWSDPSTKMEIWNGYMELMTYCQTVVDSLGDDTYFGSAIPRWFDNNPGINYLHDLQDLIDYVAIMNYVDEARRLISDAGAEIMYASTIGKKVVVGIETQRIDPPTSTYYEEGWGNMENDIYELNDYFKDKSGYDGIALHHYDYYKNFPKFGTNGKDIHPPLFLGSSFDDTQNTFNFNLVDLTGIGLDTAAVIESALVIYTSGEFDDTLFGTWSYTGHNLTFKSASPLKTGSYNYSFNMKDLAGNSLAVKQTINITVSSLELNDNSSPDSHYMLQNYPNPFNPATTINFNIPESGFTTLDVYDVLGNKVAVLISENLQQGKYSARFDAASLSSGIYFSVLVSNGIRLSQKMLLVK